jgi:hypothetical protein
VEGEEHDGEPGCAGGGAASRIGAWEQLEEWEGD